MPLVEPSGWEADVMVRGHFDVGCRRVIGDAQSEARRFGHPFIGTEHVLLGLLGQQDAYCVQILPDHGVDVWRLQGAVRSMIGDGLDPDALASIGIDVDRVRRQVESRFGTGALRSPDRWVVPQGHLPATRRTRAVLALAVQAARRFGQPLVLRDHLMLGLIDDGGGIAVRALRDQAADLRPLRLDIASYLERQAA